MLGFEKANITYVTSLAGGQMLCSRVGCGGTRDKLSPVKCFNDLLRYVQKPLLGAQTAL